MVIVFHDIHHQQRPNCTGLNTIPKRTMRRRIASRTAKGPLFGVVGVLHLGRPFPLASSPTQCPNISLLLYSSWTHFPPLKCRVFFCPLCPHFFFTRPDARYNQEKGPFLLPMTSFLVTRPGPVFFVV